ncbi:MAG: hypothetical protein ACPG19_09500 [Saprospiraceae bacterium]
MKKILMVFAVLAFVGLSTTTYAQQANSAEKATNAVLGVKKAEKKASCCASKGKKASCSKGTKSAKATKVSLSSKASTTKKGASCCASKGKNASSCSKKGKSSSTAQANKTTPKFESIKKVPAKTHASSSMDN